MALMGTQPVLFRGAEHAAITHAVSAGHQE